MLQVKVLLLASGAIEYLSDEIAVFGMRLSKDLRELGCNRLVKFEDPKRFRRPIHLIGYGIPTETAGMARRLGLSQVGLAAHQGLFGASPLAVFLLQVRI